MISRFLFPRALWVAACLACFASAARAAGSEGIRGRAALDGVLVEDVEIRVYPYRSGAFGPLTGAAATDRAVTGTDGTYHIPVVPGRYVVEALKKAEGNKGTRPETGDLYCLYSGSPISVAAGAWTAVGLNLVRVPSEERGKTEGAALRGSVTWKGKPVEKVYLYAYDDVSTGFHGPARLVQSLATGTFRVRVPPGTYYLVARKRVRGGAYGPIEIGDLFNFYARNPVTVQAGEEVAVELPLVERLSQLEEDPGAHQGIAVRVVDEAGKPVSGYYVLAYPSEQRAGPPLATSGRTDAEGRALLPLRPGERAFLRARQSLGGPLQGGELFADGATEGQGGGTTLQLRKAP